MYAYNGCGFTVEERQFQFLFLPYSNTTSINSIATDVTSSMNHAPDSLDTKIETLLRDWHHNPDLLFSIHPIDGSFLIWHIEWLDEYHPGSFRQAQISFSTRIPNAFPLGDASTMSHSVSMYSHNTGGPLLNIREVAKSSTKASTDGTDLIDLLTCNNAAIESRIQG